MLRTAAINQLLSIQSILNQIDEKDYVASLKTLKDASIGKHVRHILEFYQCLLFNANDSEVNYDDRKRNNLLEENLKHALGVITEIIDRIEKVKENQRIILTSTYQHHATSMETSLYRELAYNIEHTVHHLAIISIAIPIHFEYIKLTENIGYADSTIDYLKTKKVA